jgi:hypothetical protein
MNKQEKTTWEMTPEELEAKHQADKLPRHIARLPLWSEKRLAYIAQRRAIREVFQEGARKAFGGRDE